MTTSLRLELRDLLSPKVVLKKPFRWLDDDSGITGTPTRVRQLVGWELQLAAGHVHPALQNLSDEYKAQFHLEDFQQLLHDALDLLGELGEANDHSDPSHWDLPSIAPHWQNRGYRDWVSLIEFLRDAWLVVHKNDCARARQIAQSWWHIPYPTFKRLALFAASQDGCIPYEEWVNWLLADSSWWLWSDETQREVCRLFVLQGRNLAGVEQEHLETAILAGPPSDEQNRSIWLHLAKLKASGLTLGDRGALRLVELSTANPQWELASNESDEFPCWMSGTGDPDYEANRVVDIAPRRRQELVRWLEKSAPDRHPLHHDTWPITCQQHPLNCLLALTDLAKEGNWIPQRWSHALHAWSVGKSMKRMWRYAAPVLVTMPDAVLQEIAHSLTSWMETASKSMSSREDILIQLTNRVLALPLDPSSTSSMIRNGVKVYDPVNAAINHPIGHAVQALINFWFKRNPSDNDLVPDDLKIIFTSICDAKEDEFRHGRVLLGSRIIAFFRIDRSWTERYLLPLFDWHNPTEAFAVWAGFLWAPRVYQPLLAALKPQFLECANRYADLGDYARQFAAFLTYLALGPTEGFTAVDFRSAIAALPQEGLEESAQAIYQALEGAGDQCEDYWKNRVHPFWKEIWPKSRDKATPEIASSLFRLVIAARREFPAALATVKDWLKPIEHPHYIVHLLAESGLCKRFPMEALSLLDSLIGDQQYAPQELGQCLGEIEQTNPQLRDDARYRRLHDYFRRRGTWK